MMEKIINAGIGVHILWGIGVLGLILKIIANAYVQGLVKASENMATTKRRKLRIIRQKYENGKSLGINNGSGHAYVEKNIRSLRFLACPMEFWKRSGRFFSGIAVLIMAGGFLYYDVNWRGSPDMVAFLSSGILVCAFLYTVENIFLVNNKMEILKANIRDYLENIPSSREINPRAPAMVRRGQPREQFVVNDTPIHVVDLRQGGVDEDGDNEKIQKVREEIATSRVEDVNSSEVLDSFLEEFFS